MTRVYVDKHGQVAARYVRVLRLGRYELAVTWIERGPRCDACGGRSDVRYRGWHDDGDPMKTCSRCGDPEPDPPVPTEAGTPDD